MLRKATVRDIVDYLEYDIDPNVWINRMIHQLSAGTYEPRTPARFTVAKSKGFSRRMTMPGMPDLVLYRAIADYAIRRLRGREHKHVFFERSAIAEAARAAAEDATRTSSRSHGPHPAHAGEDADYVTDGKRRYQAWQHYNQYRRHLIFKRVYPIIVTTDITNFFDSVLHDRLAQCFQSVAMPPRMTGLLFFLLERLSIRDAYCDSPHVGLPVDEFDCSRRLAHLALFDHDDRMVKLVGEDAYVRWMDDQNIGVDGRADALKVLALIGESLARLNLTPNAGKSRILTTAEACRHFHLDINAMLDELCETPNKTGAERRSLSRRVKSAWLKAKVHEGKGEWEKILKRFYRLAGLSKVTLFQRRALSDLLAYPQLAERIADYMRCTITRSKFVRFVHSVWTHPEQVYPDVNLILMENLLLLTPSKSINQSLRNVAREMLSGRWSHRGATMCAPVAPLLLLRYADRRSLPLLRSCFDKRCDGVSEPLMRAAAIVYASYGIEQYRDVRKAAAALHSNPLAGMVRLIERIRSYKEVPGSYKQRLRNEWDSVGGRAHLDMRSIVTGRLLALNTQPRVRQWLADKKKELRKAPLSRQDRLLLDRLLP